jgi:hypothetical protein
MKVYVVTEGAYSDYHIEAIFANRKDAQRVVDRKNAPRDGDAYGEACVEEFDLRDGPLEPIIVFVRVFQDTSSYVSSLFDIEPSRAWSRETEELWWPWDDDKPRLVVAKENEWGVIVRGTDKAKVDKSFQDRVAHWKAVRAGIT